MSMPFQQTAQSGEPQELFADLPRQSAPPQYPVNFYELVPLLLNDRPDWTEDDIIELVEEKTRQPIHPEDLITLRAVYQRHLALEAEFLG